MLRVVFGVLTLFLYVMLQCLYKCVRHGSTRNFISLSIFVLFKLLFHGYFHHIVAGTQQVHTRSQIVEGNRSVVGREMCHTFS